MISFHISSFCTDGAKGPCIGCVAISMASLIMRSLGYYYRSVHLKHAFSRIIRLLSTQKWVHACNCIGCGLYSDCQLLQSGRHAEIRCCANVRLLNEGRTTFKFSSCIRTSQACTHGSAYETSHSRILNAQLFKIMQSWRSKSAIDSSKATGWQPY
jgi:hypothetical protein